MDSASRLLEHLKGFFQEHATPEALAHLTGDEAVDLVVPEGFCLKTLVWDGPWLDCPVELAEMGLAGPSRAHCYFAFAPRRSLAGKGVLILPGAGVDFRAYAPVARQLAQQGVHAVVMHVPIGIPLLDHDHPLRPDGPLRSQFPGVEHWSIGGHSLGGVAASMYTRRWPDHVDGLFFWASCPSVSHPLTDHDHPVLSLFGTHDGLAGRHLIDRHRHLLPDTTRYVEIPGGNHTQFGDYWDGSDPQYVQAGDRPAAIGREQQRHAIIRAMREFLFSL